MKFEGKRFQNCKISRTSTPPLFFLLHSNTCNFKLSNTKLNYGDSFCEIWRKIVSKSLKNVLTQFLHLLQQWRYLTKSLLIFLNQLIPAGLKIISIKLHEFCLAATMLGLFLYFNIW